MAKKNSITIELSSNKTIDKFELESVISSNIHKIGRGYIHDEKNKKEIPCIFVTFKRKKDLLYIYEGIPLTVFNEFMDAPSKGKFLNTSIIPVADETYKAVIPCLE